MRALLARTAVLAMLAGVSAGAQADAGDLAGILAQVGAHVEQYFVRAQSILFDETVRVQVLGSDGRAIGFARRLAFETRVEWAASVDGEPTAATVQRQLVTVNGRPPRPRDEPECLDPPSASPEPLVQLLPSRQPELIFSRRREERLDGRDVVTFDFRLRRPGPTIVAWDKKATCASIDAPILQRGRVWADPATGEVLRLDEWHAGRFEFDVPDDAQRLGGPAFWIMERYNSTIRYKPVRFEEPDEILLLPASIDTVSFARTSVGQQQRMTQTFSNFRRFLTGARIVE